MLIRIDPIAPSPQRKTRYPLAEVPDLRLTFDPEMAIRLVASSESSFDPQTGIGYATTTLPVMP
jgi:hypothetical protein